MTHASEATVPAKPEFHAQFGEDRILSRIFRGRGYFVEVGAFDGVTGSNSLYFESLGWDGLLIEADPGNAERCRAARRAQVVHCAVVAPGSPPEITFEVVPGNGQFSSVSVSPDLLERVRGEKETRAVTVRARTLDSILAECRAPRIDFMTIDVEGHEWAALQGLDLARWRPEYVILERNGLVPDRRIVRRMHESGYVYRRTTGVNDWFARSTRRAANGPAYRVRLLLTYWMPNASLALARSALGRIGLLGAARSVARRWRKR